MFVGDTEIFFYFEYKLAKIFTNITETIYSMAIMEKNLNNIKKILYYLYSNNFALQILIQYKQKIN